MHGTKDGVEDCAYCHAKRSVVSKDDPNSFTEETALKYYKVGFRSTKMRIDDYEELINRGFTWSGCAFYIRDPLKSCCECYQYRVDHNLFEPSDS